MKKIIQSRIFLVIVCGLIFGSIGVYGANSYQSNTIEYSPTDASWEVSNVSEAINSLYSIKTNLDATKTELNNTKTELNSTTTTLNNLKGIGDATAAQILSGKKAVVKGSTITGFMTNRGAWTNKPTESGKVTIPAGYHNGNGYIDTSSVYESGYNNGYVESKSQSMTHIGTIGSYDSQTVDISSQLTSVGVDPASLTIDDFIFTAASVNLTNTYSSGVGVSGGTYTSGSPSFSYSNGSITCSGNNANYSKYIKVWIVFNIYLK